MNAVREEVTAFTAFLRRHARELVVIAAGTLFMALAYHHPLGGRTLSTLFYFGLLPLLTIVLVLRRNPLAFGLGLGNLRLGLAYAGLYLIVALPILYFTADSPAMRAYYQDADLNLWRYAGETALYMLGWEFFFRGFLLFGLKDRLGEAAILVQMVPFTLLHFGKPEAEVLSCIVTGLLWGFFAYRTGSFWPAYVIHVVVNVANKAFIVLA